jgi:hypothetical protein
MFGYIPADGRQHAKAFGGGKSRDRRSWCGWVAPSRHGREDDSVENVIIMSAITENFNREIGRCYTPSEQKCDHSY